MDMQTQADPLAKLREPFAPHHISKLPKPTQAQTDAVKADFKKGIRCKDCGSWHHPDVVHLDYVGHAALTDRLLDTDPAWSWEPVAYRDGLPAFDQTGGLWIKLTVCGVTRLGYGHAAAKPKADPGNREKEVIGDAIRNAAMRFGAALDLWHKGDLHPEEAQAGEDKPQPPKAQPQRAARAEAPQAAAAGKPVDRTADVIPAPNNEDPGDWEAWRKVVATKINRATSIVDIGQIVTAHAALIEACDTILPDTKAKIDGFVEERKAKLATDDFRGEDAGAVAGRDHHRAAA